jgi:hypothetical protein
MLGFREWQDAGHGDRRVGLSARDNADLAMMGTI